MKKIQIVLTEDQLLKMNSKRDFNNDLDHVGKVGESMALQYYIQIGGRFIGTPGKKDRKKFDFIIELWGSMDKVEAKADNKIRPEMKEYSSVFGKEVTIPEYETGNIFVEFTSRGEGSGITTTEATIWVNTFHHLNEMWIIPVDKLKELIKNNNFEIFYNAGDENSQTHGYLIPRFEFREHFKVVEYERVVI
jgi:hypothetical protein